MNTSEVLARLDEIEKRLEDDRLFADREYDIAHARTDIPALCAAVRDLAAQVKESDEALMVARDALEEARGELGCASIKFGRYFDTYKIVGANDISNRFLRSEQAAAAALAHPLIAKAGEVTP